MVTNRAPWLHPVTGSCRDLVAYATLNLPMRPGDWDVVDPDPFPPRVFAQVQAAWALSRALDMSFEECFDGDAVPCPRFACLPLALREMALGVLPALDARLEAKLAAATEDWSSLTVAPVLVTEKGLDMAVTWAVDRGPLAWFVFAPLVVCRYIARFALRAPDAAVALRAPGGTWSPELTDATARLWEPLTVSPSADVRIAAEMAALLLAHV